MIRSPAGFDGGDRIKRYLDYYQPSYGVMMLSAGQFSPASLFAQGEQGAWYDPSDFSTMFQNSTGATPVTAVEQPVGLLLDKSGRGNHASQATSASRPVLRARYNLFLNSATLSTQNVTTVATNYTLRFEGAGSVTLSGTGSGTYNAGSHTVTCTAGTLTVTVTGSVTSADIRVANEGSANPAYQAITTATSYDTVGFPPYLFFDGTDDSLSTSGLSMLKNVNGAFICAGVRYLGTASGYITIFAADINTSVADRTALYIKSTSAIEAGGRRLDADAFQGLEVTSIPTLTNVLSGVFDYQNAQLYARVNGIQTQRGGGFQTAGNTSNTDSQAIAIGAGSIYFNGRLYSLIVRGKTSTADEITAAETWVNGKTGAY